MSRPIYDHGRFFELIKDKLPEGDIIEFGVYNGGLTASQKPTQIQENPPKSGKEI